MKHAYPLLSRPLAALALLLATAGAAQAQTGALAKTTAQQADPAYPAALGRPVSATVTTYQPLGTSAQARQPQTTLASVVVPTTTLTFANSQQGWFSPQRGHAAANNNYIVGSNSFANALYRNFFTFPLTGLDLTGKQVVGATLSVVDNGSFNGSIPTLTYVLYDVSTPAATLGATYAASDPVVTSVYNDLGTGQTYGSYTSATAVTGGRRTYVLNAAALADIVARAGQNFTIGGLVPEAQPPAEIFLFGSTGIGNGGIGQQTLTLELADAPAITTGTVGTAACAGAALSVPFTAAGTFAAGNVFAAQLSDAAGSFATPVTIGTLASTSSGTIAATVPAATAGGSGYRVRVVSSNPVVTGTDNGSAITITALPTLTLLSPATGLVGTQVTISGTNLSGATAVRFNGTAASSLVVNSATSLTATVPTGATTGNVTVTMPCGTSNGVVFTVTTSPPVLANIEPGVLPYTPSQRTTQITSTLTVSDADSPNLSGATVTISSGFVAGDYLYFVNQSGIAGSYNTATGILTLTGSASVATYQAALRSIGFSYVNTPTTTVGDRVVRFSVSDGPNTSNLLTRTVRVFVLPTVATATPGSLTTTSAVLGGQVINDGSAPITDRGVVYSPTNQLPTTSDTKDGNGTGTGSFTKTISGLAPGTTYYVRAYATNSAGTSYGSTLSFATVANTSVVSINRVGSSPTNAGSVGYTVTFAAPVTGLTTSNFALVPTGSVAGASITGLSGSGTTYTVTVSTGTGDGTLGLNLANATDLSPGLSTTLPFVGQVYTIDKTAPTVTITSPTAPNSGYTTTSPLTFVVTFSEAVVGYNISTVASNISNAAAGSLNVTAAPTYTLLLTPATAGAVTVSVPAGIVTDVAGNANLAAVPPTYSIYYNVPTAAPVVTAPANNSTTASNQPTYQGTAPAGSTVTVYVNGLSIGTTTATGGSFSLTQPTALAPGQYTVYATALASGQLASANSNTNTFTIATAPTVTMLSPATGPVGTQVMISGTNLNGATAVSFNGTAASSFVVNSATSITAIVAAGTTTGLVRVTTPNGTATSAMPFVVRVAPTTVADSYSTPQGVTLTGNVLTNDLGTNPRAILITRPANGTLVLNPDGTFTYRPNAGFTGTDSFTYYACDQGTPLLCGNPATVTITVLRIAPVTVADSYTTPAGVALTGNVLTNDLGTNPRAILITRTTNGTLVLNPDGSFTYVPNAGFTGTDSFTYYACDPNLPLLCGNPATVTITVTRVAPITVADAYSTPQGVTLTGNVLTNDLGTNPRAILINRTTNGTLVLNPDGSFSYRPNTGFTGMDSFTYYACDPNMPLLCGNPATVSITVTPANTATRTAANTAASASSPTAAAKPAASAAGGATIALELALTGHPNPFADELQLSFSLPIAQAYTLALFDAQGRLVQQLRRGQAEAGQTQQLAVPTHTYAAGLYLVRLTTATGTRQLKLIKQ
jgi:hypothetical protein